MAHSEFSETQFVFGYLSELYSNSLIQYPFMHPWVNFMFPTTIFERSLPVDFFADYYDHSEFYQFKRSDYMSTRRGRAEINAGIETSFLDYYRFKIYNRSSVTSMGQFDMLKKLAANFTGDLVCYCAPCFHTEFDFHHFFNSRSIISNSILIECNQFNLTQFLSPNFDINDGEEHYLIYKLSARNGYICSQPKEIRIEDAKIRKELIIKQDGKFSFYKIINKLYNEFYLKDEIKVNLDKKTSDDINEQFHIVSKYLMQYYNVAWLPLLKEL